MQDRDVAAAIVAGDPAGLAEAYDRYAGPLYKFCRGILDEPADAADAVHDTFVIAACRLSGLEDPERLRSWLYAVARNECRRRLRGGSWLAPFGQVTDVIDEAVDIAADVEEAELRDLVRDALSGLGPAEREVLELQIRHGLANAEVASVLGVSRNHLHALLSRARDQLETSLGVLVVARTGRRDCPVLDTMLEGWDERLTVLLRKRVNQHVRRCLVCAERRDREITPTMLLGLSPILALPLAAALRPGIKDQVLQAATGHSPVAVAHRAALTRMHTFGSHGFPRPLAPPRRPWWHLRTAQAGALAGAAAVVVSVVIVATPPHHAAGPAGGGTAGVPAGAGLAASAAGGSRLPATAAAGSRPPASATGSASASASAVAVAGGASPTATATAPAATSASASASASVSTTALSGTLSVSPATLDVAPPASGTITLTASGGPVDWSVSEPPGLTKKVIVSPMSGSLAAGAATTVSVTVDGPGKPRVHLVFSPGGAVVTVVIS